MTSPSIRSKPCPPTCTPDPCEPGTSVAVSVKSALRTKSTSTKPVKCTAVSAKEHRLLGKVKNLVRKKPVSNDCCVWPSSEVLLCNILAWVGALVIAAVVFRSLYLMYCKPEEV